MNRRTTSAARKVLFGALTLICIVASQLPTNDAEACPPARHERHATRVTVSVRWPLPAALPPIPPLPNLQLPWIVAPAPAPAPADAWPQDWARAEEEVLVLTNARRAQGAVCGDRALPPAPPLAMSAALRRAAREHSIDMGQRRYFSHDSIDGRPYSERLKAAGYEGGYSGENIFGGPPTPAAVVDGWMKSPGHCANMMAPGFKWIGVGFAEVQGSPLTSYWTQDFGG